MAIEQTEYYYKILETDSLTRIADKHGLKPTIEWARKIWEDDKNKWMHTESDRYGKRSTRWLHIGNNKYERYDHSRYMPGYRGYEDPHQIIFYGGEKIWIPKKDDSDRIRHILTDEELLEGFKPEHGKKYELVFPVFIAEVKLEEDKCKDGDKFTLYGYDENDKENIIYKKTLTMKDDAIKEEGKYPRFKFVATPTKLLYSLECTPTNPVVINGERVDKYFIFEDEKYSRN